MTDEGSGPSGRLDAELRYGMGVMDHHGRLTPYVAVSLLDDDTRTVRLGGRLQLDRSRLGFSVEGAHQKRSDGTREQGLLLNVYRVLITGRPVIDTTALRYRRRQGPGVGRAADLQTLSGSAGHWNGERGFCDR